MSAALVPPDHSEVYFVRQPVPNDALPELTLVTLLSAVTADSGATVPAGTTGVIVGVWAEGEAYEVEFAEPAGALATVEAGQLRVA